MGLEILISDLKSKYNYSNKLLNALRKIVPNLVAYYGSSIENVLYHALLATEIVLCNSYETISILLTNLDKFDRKDNVKPNLKTISNYYYSYPVVRYDELLATYVIKEVTRKIYISHTYNIDSPRGLAALVRTILTLLRSFSKEYRIIDDKLLKRTGLAKEEYKIINNYGKISFDLLKISNLALEEGCECLEEEEIVSKIISDKYQLLDYQLLKSSLAIMYNSLKLRDVFLKAVFSCDPTLIKKRYDLEEGLFDELSSLFNEVLRLEHKKSQDFATIDLRRKMDEKLKELIPKLYDNFIKFKKYDLLLF